MESSAIPFFLLNYFLTCVRRATSCLAGGHTPLSKGSVAARQIPIHPVALRRNQTVKTSVNHLFLVAFCPFGDYPFAPRHFPKVRGVARATIISLSDLVLVGACIHR